MSYLKIVGMPRQMGGVGAPKPTIFGVLGHTKMESSTKSLGGLVQTKTKGASPVDSSESIYSVKRQSDHHIEGAGRATAVSGQHYGQVPYAGKYMKPLGTKV
jgi:hypothetical protein